MRPAEAPRTLHVFLVRPSKYDDDGYVLRHWRGVLPSNSLACLHALTRDVASRGLPGIERVRIDLCDESVEAVPERGILRAARRRDVRVVVCLVGVQTSQLPRAADLARRFRVRGIDVMIGGFHVSGSLAMLPTVPRELAALLDEGVTLVAGEVESRWAGILADVAAGRLARRYDAPDASPDLGAAPVPRLSPRLLRRFAWSHFGTVDTGRGCPFACSFCTIINVQGRTMRHRDPAAVAAAIADVQERVGTAHWFFTDDNLARSPAWRDLFRALIRLREQRGLAVRFLMQADLAAHRIPDFVRLAQEAGCFQVFLGLESLDPASLRAAGKRQNRVADYAALLRTWHDAGILTHAGYIIGFPDDTPASVRDSLALLRQLEVDVASFFMRCPLPGSADHRELVAAGAALDPDLGRYDTFHPVLEHPRMSAAEWSALYQEAWRDFYTVDHMARRLAVAPAAQRTTLLQLYLWYRTATAVERFHPMMTGFVRLKPRRERPPGVAIEGRARHLARRMPEAWRDLRGYASVLAELRTAWAASGGAAAWPGFLRSIFGSARTATPPEAAAIPTPALQLR